MLNLRIIELCIATALVNSIDRLPLYVKCLNRIKTAYKDIRLRYFQKGNQIKEIAVTHCNEQGSH